MLAAARDRTVGEEVGEHHVHGVGSERLGHGGEETAHALRVRLEPRLGRVEEGCGVGEPPLGNEGHAGDERRLVAAAGADLHDRPLGRRHHARDHVDPDRIEQPAERLPPQGRVVVAGDGHDRDPRLVQAHQGVEDQRVGLRRGSPVVVEVPGDEDRVHGLLAGDADHLG
jgi:hypothetical protein